MKRFFLRYCPPALCSLRAATVRKRHHISASMNPLYPILAILGVAALLWLSSKSRILMRVVLGAWGLGMGLVGIGLLWATYANFASDWPNLGSTKVFVGAVLVAAVT